jgi:hypothetical protein
VIPAEIDFLASISTKFIFLIICGSELLLSDPRPSSPFLPKPHDHTSLFFYFIQTKPVDIAMAVAQKDLKRNLEFIIDGSEKIFVFKKILICELIMIFMVCFINVHNNILFA